MSNYTRPSRKTIAAHLFRIAEHVRTRASALNGLTAAERFMPWDNFVSTQGEIRKHLGVLQEWLKWCDDTLAYANGETDVEPTRPKGSIFYMD